MIILLSTLTTVFMVASLSLDVIVFLWHREDRRRFTADEARLTEDEQILGKKTTFKIYDQLGPGEVSQLRAFLRERIPGQ